MAECERARGFAKIIFIGETVQYFDFFLFNIITEGFSNSVFFQMFDIYTFFLSNHITQGFSEAVVFRSCRFQRLSFSEAVVF